MSQEAKTLNNNRIAIMQPYFAPYLGYFQLIAASDVFVFYDDVQFMKKGWLRRNRIWSNEQEQLISIPCIGASSNQLIKEIQVAVNHPNYIKIKKSILQSYARAPEFKKVRPLVEYIFDGQQKSLAEFNADSIVVVLDYLNLRRELTYSSQLSPESRGLSRSDRLIAITKKLEGSTYINSIGGQDLYDKSHFNQNEVELKFLHPNIPVFQNGPRRGLPMNFSIIDTLMWNDVNELQQILKESHTSQIHNKR
jgi:hypothetical protein